MDIIADRDRGRAAAYLGRVNMELIKAAAGRRQGQGRGNGARPPASLAGDPVQLVEVKGPGGRERITPLGYRTAQRSLPPLLARLEAGDHRLEVARMLADAVERVGSVQGSDLAGSDSNAGVSDGGATTRVKHAARFRLMEAFANRWGVDRRRGRIEKGGERSLMSVRRKDGRRRNIMAFAALIAVCVEGASLDAILRAHGWSAQTTNRNKLRDAVLEALDDMAEGLGLITRNVSKPVDSA